MRYSETEKADARALLAKYCPPGTVVYTSLVKVARSGMSRQIALHVMDCKHNEIRPITWAVSRLLGLGTNNGTGSAWAVKVSGCGMDMGFHVVNSLSYALHGHKSKGADAIAASGRPFTPRRGHYRAGYSLIQRWL